MLSRKARATTLLALTLSSPLVVSLPLAEKRLSFSSHLSPQSPLDVWDPSLRQLSVIHGRSLVDDTLRGLLGGLSIIPGTVELSNLLLGDGKTGKGLLGSLGGLLLDVTPPSSANDTSIGGDADAATGSQSNATAVNVATGESYGYSLVASKKQTSQVYLMPVRQADVVPAPSNTSAADSASTPSRKNDTILVKMLVHAVQRDENPTLMCATYGASPPTDLDVAPCTPVNGSTEEQSSSSGGDTEAQATGAKQLFKYNRQTGELSPMFDDVPVTADGQDAVPSTSNSTEPETTATSDPTQESTIAASTMTPLTEMRMHFKAATATDDPENESSNTKANDQPDESVPTPDSSKDDHDCSDDAGDDDAQDTTSSHDPATAAVRITLGAE